jgi:dipeptidyl aminopeptidase
VTFDGGTDVFNGIPDWVFEEEVFASQVGIWWSPDSRQIAYLRINESEVPVYSIPYYISDTREPLSYPQFEDLKYPKAGYPNPVIDVWVYEIGDIAFKVEYEEPLETREEDDWFGGLFERDGDELDGWGDKKLITNVLWMGNDMVMLSETNRVSDHFRTVLVDVPRKSAQIVRDEKIDSGWFEIVFVACGTGLILVA